MIDSTKENEAVEAKHDTDYFFANDGSVLLEWYGKEKESTESDTSEQKFEGIQRLYEGYYNTDQDVEVFAKEFYYAIGEILSESN